MKRLIHTSLCLLIVLLMSHPLTPAQEERPQVKAFIIPLEGMIDGGLYSSLERRVGVALQEKPSLIIFEIDTYGGRLEPAFDISEYIVNIKDTRTLAYIPSKAISAGALITVACNEIVMGPQAELGDCEPIIPSTEGGYKTAGEKIQTVLRTKFRKFAEKNGYPPTLAEAMVTREMEVYRITTEEGPQGRYITARELKEMTEEETKKIKSKKLIVEEGKLLTMHAREAKEYGFAKYIVENRNELFKEYSLTPQEVKELVTNWSEDMVRFLDSIAPILLGVGLVALYMEMKAPGLGLPGLIGVLCLATVFLSKYMVGLAEVPEMLIFALGVMLLAIEIFLLPGFGIFGVAGIALMFTGIVLSFQEFLVPQTPFHYEELRGNLLQILSSITGSIIVMIILIRYLPEMPIFGRLVLKAAEVAELGFGTTLPPLQAGLVGKRGYALSMLRPSGRAQIGEEVLDVVTQGEFVDSGQTVEVMEIKGNRIIVRPV